MATSGLAVLASGSPVAGATMSVTMAGLTCAAIRVGCPGGPWTDAVSAPDWTSIAALPSVGVGAAS